jgi:hypothetical protein
VSIFRGNGGGAALATAALLALATACGSGTDEPADGSKSTASRPTSHPVKDTSITAELSGFGSTRYQYSRVEAFWPTVSVKRSPGSAVMLVSFTGRLDVPSEPPAGWSVPEPQPVVRARNAVAATAAPPLLPRKTDAVRVGEIIAGSLAHGGVVHLEHVTLLGDDGHRVDGLPTPTPVSRPPPPMP